MMPPGALPLAEPRPRTRTRALPWASIMAASTLTAVPVVATVPLMPPAGLLMLLAWRLLARFSLRPWAAAPLGFWDDLNSGQPLGSAVLLWSLSFIAIEAVESRMVFRDFWQDWLIAGAAITLCLVGGRFLAVPLAAPVGSLVAAQVVASVLCFPLAARTVAWIDHRREAHA